MLVRRINPICIRAQHIIQRHRRFLLVPPTRHLSTNSEIPDKGIPKTDVVKSDLLSRLMPLPKKKIDFRKKVLEIGSLAWEATKNGAVVLFDHLRHPAKIPVTTQYLWQLTKQEAHHYWVGIPYNAISYLLVSTCVCICPGGNQTTLGRSEDSKRHCQKLFTRETHDKKRALTANPHHS